jgi:two-component system, OmpR family, response regulator
MSKAPLRSVMYVDDEPDIREVVEMSLGLVADLAVHTADSGEQALVELPRVRPDMVLLDVMMPGMDGPTTLARMRAQPELSSIPVVFMTAKAMPQEIARFIEMGAAAVISKPFDPMTLGAQVVKVWEGLARG